MPVETMKEAAAMGAKLEFVFNGAGKEFELAGLAKAIRAVGVEHCVLTTDYGQAVNPFPADGFAGFLAALGGMGFTEGELEVMSVRNPAWLLNLSPFAL